jgi:Uncharacterised nucleotidyltransferase
MMTGIREAAYGTEHGASVPTDATAQLLLLLARENLTEEQGARARKLIAEIADWEHFARLAHANFSAPFVYRHLRTLGLEALHKGILDQFQALAFHATFGSLKIMSAMSAFHAACIEPVKADHVYVKGPALAARYYKDACLRRCRDVDVLVGQSYFPDVATLARKTGHRFLIDVNPITFTDDPSLIDFMIRHEDVLSFFDSNNVHIELHRRLDYRVAVFPVHELLRDVEKIKFASIEVNVMSTTWLFNYICYHHSRHFWSRLHWVADLHAIMAHPTFNVDRVLVLSEELGIRSTVEPAIEFANLTDKPETWSDVLGRSHAGMFLEGCLSGLAGDSAYEFDHVTGHLIPGIGLPWQVDRSKRASKFASSVVRRLKPTISQFTANPRPKSMEWAYYVENAMMLSGRAVRRLGFPWPSSKS